MSVGGSRSSSVSTDYELIQPRTDRLRRGYSIRDSMTPYHRPPDLHNIQRQPQSSSKHLRNLRLSASRQKKYTGLQWNKVLESDYAVPTTTHYTRPRRQVDNSPTQRYDRFFRGSISEPNERGEDEEEEEGEGEPEQSIIAQQPDTEQSCKRRRCAVAKTIFCVIFLVLALLLSLAALGFTLYAMYSSSSDSDTQDCSRCDHVWCTETVTVAKHEDNCTSTAASNKTYCTTEALTTNITVSLCSIT